MQNVSLSFLQGEMVALVGPNGSGKTTFFKILAGLLKPTAGIVTVFGKNPKELKEEGLLGTKIGLVFQNPDNQIVAAVVEEDVAFGPENLNLSTTEIKRRVEEALRLTGLWEFRKRASYALSGGQKQRLAIAGALALKPQILLLDEPTSMLDPEGRQEVLELLIKLNREENLTIIFITHYMDEALRAKRLVAFKGGGVAFDGQPQEFFAKKSLVESLGLDSPPLFKLVERLKAEGLTLSDAATTPEKLVEELCQLI
ncbi:energy-coupling factor transporter ATPase [Carboxydothermus pertinax]|uniref:Energy-coupling factor transporter ATPase n=1 Tax=Carboxydothermus pertinax TaxID=870242 RepID=A0A1L8CY57_9THEO|nr:energy-coupling factor transporter ATPase [Carboxydothermus pertinax]